MELEPEVVEVEEAEDVEEENWDSEPVVLVTAEPEPEETLPPLIYCAIDDSYRQCGSDELQCVDNSEKYCPTVTRLDDDRVQITNIFNFHTAIDGDIIIDADDDDSDDDEIDGVHYF